MIFKVTEYVKASSLFEGAKDFVDRGYKEGLGRGYNIEVIVKDSGETKWLECVYTREDPNDLFNNAFYTWYFRERAYEPTGRLCFRGYGKYVYVKELNKDIVVPLD